MKLPKLENSLARSWRVIYHSRYGMGRTVIFIKSLYGDLPLAVMVAGMALIGLWVSNIVYDRGVPNYVSRKIGHGAGGLAFLVSYAMASAWWPIIISVAFTALLMAGHFMRPQTIRGVGGSGRSERILAEVYFPLTAVPVYAIAWLWLKRPEAAVACLLFMAWGDGVTGIVRAQVYKGPVKGMWGSVAMLAVCLCVSWVFIRPFWIGAIASILATVVEWSFGEYGVFKWADDNWAVPAVSLIAVLGIMALNGNL